MIEIVSKLKITIKKVEYSWERVSKQEYKVGTVIFEYSSCGLTKPLQLTRLKDNKFLAIINNYNNMPSLKIAKLETKELAYPCIICAVLFICGIVKIQASAPPLMGKSWVNRILGYAFYF